MKHGFRLFRLVAVCTALAGTLSACAPVTVKTLNVLAPASTHETSKAVPFGTLPRLKTDVYRPTSAPPSGGYPVVVFFYGGSWNTGERATYEFVGEALASRGILVFIPDYRLYPQVRYPDFLNDSAQAVAFALDRASAWGGNQKRVFVMGHSAGAYNAAMVALDAKWLTATGHSPAQLSGLVGLAGAFNFLPTNNPDVQPVFHYPDYPKNSQPVDYAKAGSPPAFLGAAVKDKLVYPDQNTQELAKRLREAGVPVDVKMYTRVTHTTLIGSFAAPLRWLSSALDDTAEFVQREDLAKP